MLAGIAFAVIGVGLLFASIKTMLSEDKIKKAKAAKDAAMAAAAGGELKKENEPETKKTMSIADRANLTKRLEGGRRRGMKILITLLKPLSFLPALLMMYIIFSFSAQPGEVSGNLSYKVSYKIVEDKK